MTRKRGRDAWLRRLRRLIRRTVASAAENKNTLARQAATHLMALTEEQRLQHNRWYEEASALIKNQIPLHERPDLPAPGWLLRRRLKRAIRLYQKVLELNPGNWSAMWLIGKVQQRLGDPAAALSWFDQAYQVNPSQPDVAR